MNQLSDRADIVASMPEAESSPAWRRAVTVGLGAYVVSRICVLAAALTRAAQLVVDDREDGEVPKSAARVVGEVLSSWDGRWYLEIVRNGYPSSVPPDITYHQVEARAAFFPVYPWIVRVVDWVVPGGDTLAALVTNLVMGAAAVVLVGVLARQIFHDDAIAEKAMVVFAIFPGSFVLSFAYAEATFIVLAAACLVWLLREQWWLAGAAAAVATATRPNGTALMVACAVASFLAIRRSRDWASLAAPALSPIGFVFFQWWVGDVAHERGVWFRVQSEAWGEGVSFGQTAMTNTFDFLQHPLSSPTDALTALSLVALAAGIWAAYTYRVPPPVLAYTIVVIVLMLVPATVTARPRFLFTAFPLFVSVGAWWMHNERRADRPWWQAHLWTGSLVLAGAGLVTLTSLYAVFGAIP